MRDIQRYLNMVTSQHQNKPKFEAWLSAPLTLIDDVALLADVFNLSFNLDLAVGSQLDILGIILGVQRRVSFQPTSYYSTGVLGSVTLIEPSPVLDDEYYRLIVRAKILQNMWDGTIPSLYDIWNELFTDAYLIVKDNQDMTMNAYVIGLSSQLQKDLVTNGYVIPKPQGVSISYSYTSEPLFSFGVESSDLKGFGEGVWSNNF